MSATGTIYDELADINSWVNFTPGEVQYARFSTNLIFTAMKITDLYYSLCIARANLHFLDNNDFGDYAKDEQSIKFIKSMHIQNSLIFYNIAVDYSWQVLWLYYMTDLNTYPPTSKLYEKAIEGCNYEELILGLTLERDFKMRDNIVKPFFQKNAAYSKIRPMYNYLKHRGTYHFDGLGLNRKEMMLKLVRNGQPVDLPVVYRKEMDIELTKSLLLQFDRDFVEYMFYLIDVLMPKDFTTRTIPFNEMLTALINKY